MIKNLSVLFLIALFITLTANAQQKAYQHLQRKGLIIDAGNQTHVNNYTHMSKITDGDYILVDTMANAFGTGSSSINPLAFDPMTNTLAVDYRGYSSYATGSGELWYSVSTDDGATWTRVAAVNGGVSQQLARYPSMTISNSSFGTNAIFGWAELASASSFGYFGYGIDNPIGGGAPFGDIITSPGNWSSDTPVWASDNSDYVYWSDRALAAPFNVTLFRTQDFSTIDRITPPQWSDTALSSWGCYQIGGVSFHGVEYMGLIAPFAQATPDYIPIGYSMSTDNGDTWSNFDAPDFRTIPGLEQFDELMDIDTTDGNTVSYDGDINVDYKGYVHLVTALTDTATYTHAVVDMYKTETGWKGEVVFSGLDRRAYGLGPGLGQMGPSPYVAFDSSRKVIAVQWINSNPTSGWADIFISHKRLDDTGRVWSAPVNLTNSELINNTAAHLAPQIKDDGDGHYTAFSLYSWVLGAPGPYADTTQPTGIYVAPVNFDEFPPASAVENNNIKAYDFNLTQNYPNPFNPSTKISYTLPERNNVSLKVFNMLGQEVATLVNSEQSVGLHSVNFDASKLASGIYIYKIQAGNFTQSKKMMLLK